MTLVVRGFVTGLLVTRGFVGSGPDTGGGSPPGGGAPFLVIRGFIENLLLTRGLGSGQPLPPPSTGLRFDDWSSTMIDAAPDPLDIDPDQTTLIN